MVSCDCTSSGGWPGMGMDRATPWDTTEGKMRWSACAAACVCSTRGFSRRLGFNFVSVVLFPLEPPPRAPRADGQARSPQAQPAQASPPHLRLGLAAARAVLKLKQRLSDWVGIRDARGVHKRDVAHAPGQQGAGHGAAEGARSCALAVLGGSVMALGG